MTLHFRLATEANIPTIASILTECAEYSKQFEINNSWPVPFPYDEIAKTIKQNETYIVENEEEEEIVATFRLIFSDPEFWGWLEGKEEETLEAAYLHKLAVRRAFSHRGIGEKIISWVEDFAKIRGCSYLRLDCSATNQFIQTYYESKGFRRVRTVEIVRSGIKRPYLLMEKNV